MLYQRGLLPIPWRRAAEENRPGARRRGSGRSRGRRDGRRLERLPAGGRFSRADLVEGGADLRAEVRRLSHAGGDRALLSALGEGREGARERHLGDDSTRTDASVDARPRFPEVPRSVHADPDRTREEADRTMGAQWSAGRRRRAGG